MKKIYFLLFFLSAAFSASAKTEKTASEYASFSFTGGMYYAFGYMSFTTNHGDIGCFSNGIGGRLHFNTLNEQLRVGGMGAVCNLNYDKNNSYLRYGYGGITLEYIFNVKRFRMGIGGMIGGGSLKDYYLFPAEGSENMNVRYTKQGTFIFSPMISLECFITKSISLLFSVEYPIGTRIGEQHTLTYPQMKLGILFSRKPSRKVDKKG